jgi:hypothetical protein
LGERGLCNTDRSRRLARLTVVDWLEELPRQNGARKDVSRPATPVAVNDAGAENPVPVLESSTQSIRVWIVQWIWSIVFNLFIRLTIRSLALLIGKAPSTAVPK